MKTAKTTPESFDVDNNVIVMVCVM